jgi:regulator of sigma E protease
MLDLIRTFQVAFGIGLVIFVHELGHFLAARYCGVRVNVFSLGFGPKLFGFQRGATLYQVAAVPLGGFVSMAGEGLRGGRAPKPDEVGAKSVGQRFLIYSGGVLMNLLFALVALPLVFLYGVPFTQPVIGEPLTGSPAWHAGLEEGTEIRSVNGHRVVDFLHISTEVALGNPERAELELVRPGSDTVERVVLVPEKNDLLGFYTIGVTPAVDRAGRIGVREGGPAAAAGLPDDVRVVGFGDAPEEFSIERQFVTAAEDGGPIEVRYLEEGAPAGAPPASVVIEPDRSQLSDRPILGIAPVAQWVRAVRPSAGSDALDLRTDDRVVRVDGEPLVDAGDWREAILEAWGQRRPVEVVVVRGDAERTTRWIPGSRAEAIALVLGVALSPDLESTRVTVTPDGGGWQAGLRPGDRILSVDGVEVREWEPLRQQVAAAAESELGMELRVERRGQATPLVLTARAARPPLVDYGFSFMNAEYLFQADGFVEALQVGVASSIKLLEDTWLTLKRMFLAQVSTQNMGGIISISRMSYSWAESGWSKLFYFLCILSINLAFLNVLPIPLLDGGHLLFLLIEKLKGSPVSERALGYSQMVGLVFIVGLMVYVTYNDLMRWIGS